MKNITNQIAIALHTCVRRRISNTECTGASVYLHGNEIARYCAPGKIEVSLAGPLSRLAKG